MKLNPDGLMSGGDEPDRSPEPARSGIASRVEAASKMRAPPPPGRGLAMIAICVAVVIALIWDSMSDQGPGKKVRDIERNQGASLQAEKGPGEPLELKIKDEGAELTLSAPAAIAYYTSAPAEKQAQIRPKLLDTLAAIENLKGRRGQEAYELASRLVEGADARSQGAIDDLVLMSIPLLQDDTAAPAVAFFLGAAPKALGRVTTRALDRVILDGERPMHVRVAAAEVRPADDRPEELSALASDAKTHPALRKALARP